MMIIILESKSVRDKDLIGKEVKEEDRGHPRVSMVG